MVVQIPPRESGPKTRDQPDWPAWAWLGRLGLLFENRFVPSRPSLSDDWGGEGGGATFGATRLGT